MQALHLSASLLADINSLVHSSNLAYMPPGTARLRTPQTTDIRAGRAGGLPFDSLTTDLVSGCLSARQACYGICFAAKGFWEHGIDFGTRIANRFDPKLLSDDLRQLPADQRYLRNGWNSDPSWDWPKAVELAQTIRDSGRLTIFISKAFKQASADAIRALVSAGAELRISISALDNNLQLDRRLNIISDFRDAGGVAVPIVMSAAYNDRKLRARQDSIVDWLTANDFPAAENSLRFPRHAPITSLIDQEKTRPIDHTNDIWSGRLYAEKLIFPTTTTVPSWYAGLPSGYLSKLDRFFIESLFIDPVMTHAEVMSSERDLRHPRQCGVSQLDTGEQ